MFTFTKRADYALLALSFLATEGSEKLVSPRTIAAKYEIPQELLAKIMQTLSKKHLIVSVPGPTGGYRLEKAPASISIVQVIEAVDGPLAIAQCWEESGVDGCAQGRRCILRGPLARIQEQIAGILQEMTLEDVITPEAPKVTRQYPEGRSLTVFSSRQGTVTAN
jgi:Rrf2 family protein